ncbi:hypothetical protein Dsin_001214 [Dipteronia sinensis]|uniref:RNase H type-1 domain-containing protein n=1 Tax=Dipteronia sinensis TaxID=43782 RepID=A0AAE0B3K0_9ROSI|nr:hypothetical protein Dsin_001214 [Dipteronia sinensis]
MDEDAAAILSIPIEIPSKVKVFIWRACGNWIPKMKNLCRGGVPVSPTCPLCAVKDESTWHALCGCRCLKDVQLAFPLKKDWTGGTEWSKSYISEFHKCNEPVQRRNRVGVEVAIWKSTDSGFLSVVIESDAAVVVKWINEESIQRSDAGLVLEENLTLIRSLGRVVVQFLPRKANQVAHFLAKNAPSSVEDNYWLEEFPPCVRSFVLADGQGSTSLL